MTTRRTQPTQKLTLSFRSRLCLCADELLLRLQRTGVLRFPDDAGIHRLPGLAHLCATHLQARQCVQGFTRKLAVKKCDC